MERIAAIDIGSNAIRLTTADLKNKDKILVDEKIRIPIRLGTHAFSEKQLFSKKFIKYAEKTFKEIRITLDNLNVTRCRTVATSALRDAKNSKEFIDAIYKSSGIKIHTISGNTEADLILKAIQNSDEIDDNADYLLFDLGGGSLELSLIEDGDIISSNSIDLGTVRLLEFIKKHNNKKEIDQAINEKLKSVKTFLKKELKNSKNLTVVGTGGNFRRLIKLKNIIWNKSSKFVTVEEINLILKILEKTSYLEKIQKFDLRPDRADIIVPALTLISKVLEDLPVKKVTAPRIGLIQGILLDMSDGMTKVDQVLQ